MLVAVSSLSVSTQNYLKVIWAATEWDDSVSVGVTRVAEALGLRPSTVSDGLKKLGADGLVRHEPYAGVTLTPLGREYAVAMVRRHRLIETFLVTVLGYTWDEVHDEAEVLEHAMSDTLINRLDALLGFPERDPHGDPIPSASGQPRRQNAHLLAEAEPGKPWVVSRISDENPDMLRYFANLGLVPGALVQVHEHRPFAGVSAVQILHQPNQVDAGGGIEPGTASPTMVDLGTVALAAIWVEAGTGDASAVRAATPVGSDQTRPD